MKIMIIINNAIVIFKVKEINFLRMNFIVIIDYYS